MVHFDKCVKFSINIFNFWKYTKGFDLSYDTKTYPDTYHDDKILIPGKYPDSITML